MIRTGTESEEAVSASADVYVCTHRRFRLAAERKRNDPVNQLYSGSNGRAHGAAPTPTPARNCCGDSALDRDEGAVRGLGLDTCVLLYLRNQQARCMAQGTRSLLCQPDARGLGDDGCMDVCG